MTPEEIQTTLEQMLAVQRELQESQLQLQDGQVRLQQEQEAQKAVLDELIERYGDLSANSERQQRILEQLIGYSLTNESEHMTLEEKLEALQARVQRLENRN
jgi:polyhydroxyalkanoate synthesis regulator phasin